MSDSIGPFARAISLAATLIASSAASGLAQGQVHLSCAGTVLEAQGSSQLKRGINTLRLSLSLEAAAADRDAALAVLQQRLAVVRSALRSLGVVDLAVSSPSTWQRPANRFSSAATQASLQINGQLPPGQLQPLVRQVGALPGVQLAPVSAEADSSRDRISRLQLLRGAYQDALHQAQDLASVLGLPRLQPIEVTVVGGMRPLALRAAAMADAAPPFDPNELQAPVDRLSLRVLFCAR